MSSLQIFLWVAFPWLAVVACVVGVVWRWRTDQFGWTTHSSQIYESKLLRLSSPLFHYGMLFVFVGHLMGLAFPKEFTRAVGLDDHTYHLVATIPGTIAGIAAVLGLIGLIYRRFVNRTVRMHTSRSDKVMYLLLTLAIMSGFIATVSTQVFGGPHGYDYRETISPWLRELFILWPATRLVHALSAPVGYVTRPYVVYRSRDIRTQPTRQHTAWEPVRTNKHQPAEEARWSGA